MLPRKQKWPVYAVVVLTIVVLAGAMLRLLLSGGEQEQQQSLDERLRSVCERDPAPAEVRALVGDVVGRYQDGKGCSWREGAASRQLVARHVSMSLDQWTRSLGRTDLTTRIPKGVDIKVVRSSAHCTAAFDNTAGGIVEVETPTELDPDCWKTAAAAAPIADAIR
ncbi:hypothetical protein GCM10010178_44360 [Lentzea flava]|uniref:Uncharacterized protein n=2 Tax=Lentzea flava TaxID=103732 RepID=A0ABQ2URN0_9PSEU|nr:hypothetical protein [Lentzea flava]MCP2200930.1 hypothetical protein [Lentzea flava]GGU47004.1 hypothetical protein GCM10010178_44360 [Lentzea flava]